MSLLVLVAYVLPLAAVCDCIGRSKAFKNVDIMSAEYNIIFTGERKKHLSFNTDSALISLFSVHPDVPFSSGETFFLKFVFIHVHIFSVSLLTFFWLTVMNCVRNFQ